MQNQLPTTTMTNHDNIATFCEIRNCVNISDFAFFVFERT